MKYFILFLLFLTASCKPAKVTTEIIYRDTTIIRETTKVVTVPGDTIRSNSVHIDSLRNLLQSGASPQVIERLTIREDPETGNRVGILIDELGNLTALCEIQERQIELLEREITRLQSEIKNTTIIRRPGFLERIKDAFDLILYTAAITAIILILIRR